MPLHSSVDAQNAIVGSLLIATGIGFVVLELTGHEHRHSREDGKGHSHRPGDVHGRGDAHGDGDAAEPGHRHPDSRHRSLLAVMIPFGAAASPDLTILPVFLAATTAGPGTAIGALVVFAVVTIATIVSLTLIATAGGYQIRGLARSVGQPVHGRRAADHRRAGAGRGAVGLQRSGRRPQRPIRAHHNTLDPRPRSIVAAEAHATGNPHSMSDETERGVGRCRPGSSRPPRAGKPAAPEAECASG